MLADARDLDPAEGAALAASRVEACLAAVCGTAAVVGSYLACAWLPESAGDRSTREAISRLVGALGTEPAWPSTT